MADETKERRITNIDPVINEVMDYAFQKQLEASPEDISILSGLYLDKEIKSLAAFVNGTRDAILGVAHDPDDEFFIKYSDKSLDIAARKLIAAIFIDGLVCDAVKIMINEGHNYDASEMAKRLASTFM